MTTLPALEDLEILVEVARAGSIGRAAGARGLSQPSVSRRMSALERSLRVPLLSRSPRGTTLTPAGRVVVDWASTLLDAAEGFRRQVSSLRDSRAVEVRAAVSMTIAEHHAPAWLARLQQCRPELTVSLVVHNSTDVADRVESHDANLGFIESPTMRRGLHHRRIGSDRLVVAVPPGHPWSGRKEAVPADEFAASGLLMREPGSGTRETIEHALQRSGLRLTREIVMGSNAALRSAAVAGMGPVVLSELAVAPELATGQLVEIGVCDLSLRRPLTAIWRRDEELSAGAVELLRVAIQKAPSG